MVKYICAGCDEEIKRGNVLILITGKKDSYLHTKIRERNTKNFLREGFDKDTCLRKYMDKGNNTIKVRRILPYSTLTEKPFWMKD